MPFDYYPYDLVNLFSKSKEVLRCAFDYCTVFYYSFSKLEPFLKSILGEYFNNMRCVIGYEPAS